MEIDFINRIPRTISLSFRILNSNLGFLRAVSKLKTECFELRRQVDELKVVKMMMEKRVEEELVSERKQFAEEIRFHSRTNQQLKAQLDGIMAQKDIK